MMFGLLFICCAGPAACDTATVPVHDYARAHIEWLHNNRLGVQTELLHIGKPWSTTYIVHWPPPGERVFAVEQFSIVVWQRRSVGIDGAFVDVRQRHNFFPTTLDAYFAKRKPLISYWSNSAPEWISEPYYGRQASPALQWLKERGDHGN